MLCINAISFVGLCVAQDFTQGVLIDRQNVSRLRNLSPEIATNMLQDAITNNQYKFLKRFVDLGGDINVRNRKGLSLLHRACFWGYLECARKLVQLNAEMMNDQMNQFKVTPLMVAIANERFDVAKFLIKAGAKKDLLTTTNKTSLDVAMSTLTRNIDMVVADDRRKDTIFYIIGLLSQDVCIQGSDTDVRIKGEMAAFQYMEKKNNQEMLSIFKQHGFCVNMVKETVIFREIMKKFYSKPDEMSENRLEKVG